MSTDLMDSLMATQKQHQVAEEVAVSPKIAAKVEKRTGDDDADDHVHAMEPVRKSDTAEKITSVEPSSSKPSPSAASSSPSSSKESLEKSSNSPSVSKSKSSTVMGAASSSSEKSRSAHDHSSKKQQQKEEEKPEGNKNFNLGFPLEGLAQVGEYVLVGGGGGEAQTGIINAIVLLQWGENGLRKLLTHPTGTETPALIAAHPNENIFAYVGRQNECRVFSFAEKGFTERPAKQGGVGVTEGVKLIKFNRQGDMLVSVDTEDKIRTLLFPSMKVKNLWNSEQQNVQDIEWDKSGATILTISADNQCKLWRSDNGSLIGKLPPPPQLSTETNVLVRNARFGPDGTLYLAFIKKPDVSRDRSRRSAAQKGRCYLAKCVPSGENASAYTYQVVVSALPNEHHTCFALSDDARFVALGTADGDLHIFGTKYLNRVNKTKAHEWVVTGALFSQENKRVVSVSMDHSLRCSRPLKSTRSYLNMLFAIVMLVLLYYVVGLVTPHLSAMLGGGGSE